MMRSNFTFTVLLIITLPFLVLCGGKKEIKTGNLKKAGVCCVGQDGRPHCPPPESGCVDYLPYVKDEQGRYIFIHGINLSGSNKFPVNEDPCTFEVSGIPTYVGKPFPLEKADEYFAQIKNLGFNTVRFLISIEGVMPESPDRIDEKYLDYIEQLIKKAAQYDIYVLIDSHTDAVFSRFLISRFNDTESPIVQRLRTLLSVGGGIGGIIPVAETIGALIPNSGKNKCKGKDIDFPYNNAVRGNMFPKWAIQAIFPERNLDSHLWGYPRILFLLRKFIDKEENWQKIVNVVSKFDKNIGEILKGLRSSVISFIDDGLKNFPSLATLTYEEIITGTTDMLPWTNWGTNVVFSLDVQRSWASFFAGKDVYPDLYVEGKNIQEYLQSAYEKMWSEVARRVKKLRDQGIQNVIGYDLMNEPGGFFLILTLAAAYFQIGSKDGVVNLVDLIFNDKQFSEDLVDILIGIGILPEIKKDNRDEVKKLWGFDKANLIAMLGLNYGFDRNYILPFHERMGKAIEREDPDAIIFVEKTIASLEQFLFFLSGESGSETYFDIPYIRPNLRQVVYAPHWYADIYPFPGFNSPYRVFQIEEKRRKSKEYKNSISGMISTARKYMGGVPVVLGEFGTYFTLSSSPVGFEGGRYIVNLKDGSKVEVDSIWRGAVISARDENFIIPRLILNDYYEALDELVLSRIQWVWSWENDDYRGEGWNAENFSIVEPVPASECRGIKNPSVCEGDPYIARIDNQTYLVPRGYDVYVRTHPDFLSGKPKSLRFFSKLHYFDPEKGIVNRVGEFEMMMESKETDAPTQIYIPYYVYYPKGFYVWVSDGYVVYDHKNFRLYWFPEVDDPGFVHKITIRGIIDGQVNEDWDYFFKEDTVISRKRK